MMNQYQDTGFLPNRELKDRARGALTGRFGQAVLAFFVASIISFGAGLVVRFFGSFVFAVISLTKELMSGSISADAMFNVVLLTSRTDFQFAYNLFDLFVQLLTSVFTGVFTVGLSLVWLNLACGRPVQTGDIFYGFKCQFRKSLQLSAVHTLVQWIFLFPGNIFLYLMDLSQMGMEVSDAVLAFFACLTIIGAIVAAYLLLRISQCFFLMLDFPDHSAGQLLRLSCRIMNGHKKRLLLLYVSFLPLLILSAFTLGIGYLWVLPYLNVARAFFFLNLMQARDCN